MQRAEICENQAVKIGSRQEEKGSAKRKREGDAWDATQSDADV